MKQLWPSDKKKFPKKKNVLKFPAKINLDDIVEFSSNDHFYGVRLYFLVHNAVWEVAFINSMWEELDELGGS